LARLEPFGPDSTRLLLAQVEFRRSSRPRLRDLLWVPVIVGRGRGGTWTWAKC
jgi:hypothetical protein